MNLIIICMDIKKYLYPVSCFCIVRGRILKNIYYANVIKVLIETQLLEGTFFVLLHLLCLRVYGLFYVINIQISLKVPQQYCMNLYL